jgi:predicted secreted hydrolase
MFYRLRNQDGSTSPFSGGSLVDAGSTVTRLTADAVELSASREWTSPETNVRYPVAWQMTIPSQGLELAIEPRIDDQELDLTVRYWEGAVTVTGRSGGRPVSGVGYLELAGY